MRASARKNTTETKKIINVEHLNKKFIYSNAEREKEYSCVYVDHETISD